MRKKTFSSYEEQKGFPSQKQKDTFGAFLYVFVILLGYRCPLRGIEPALFGRETEGRSPRFSALLWSLVSPRDQPKSPDRFAAKLQERWETLGSKGVAFTKAASHHVNESLQSREDGSHPCVEFGARPKLALVGVEEDKCV